MEISAACFLINLIVHIILLLILLLVILLYLSVYYPYLCVYSSYNEDHIFLGKKIFIVSKQKNRQKIQKIDIYNIHKLYTKKKKKSTHNIKHSGLSVMLESDCMICLSCSANILHMSHYTNIYNTI